MSRRRRATRLSNGRTDRLSEADLCSNREPTPDPHHKCPYNFQLEGEKSQGTSLQREIQGLQESVVELQKKTERLQHDLGSKESQNRFLQV